MTIENNLEFDTGLMDFREGKLGVLTFYKYNLKI